ncbi:MAG: TetR/AcrR family transcriptional regulator [Rhodospirillales bacterium]|nr:TetR/AcrR family transcriptional regulator [Rhodospirillales bacterium]
MARPREFDTEEALEQALQVFWTKGYEAASLCDLIAAMGISKSSFYETFGSKHALFLTVLDRYNDKVAGCQAEQLIEAAGSVKAGIATVFEDLIERMADGGDRRGCFLNNCAVEIAPHDPAAAAKVSVGLGRMEASFLAAIEEGQARGEIPARHSAAALARYLTGALNGLMVLAKGGRNRLALKEVAGIALAALD